MLSRNIYIFVFILFANMVFAQDPHLSQGEKYADYSNVSRVGMMDTDFSLSGSYRSQWNSIPDGFKTYGVSFEQKLKTFAYGLDVVSNNAGEASLYQNNLRAKLSYNKVLANQSSLRIGAAVGVIQQRFNPESFQFDKQYEPGVGFNSSLGNQETFDNTNHSLLDLSAGLMYITTIGKLDTEIGLGMLHLNQPGASFYLDGTETYPMRSFWHIKAKYPVSEKVGLYGVGQYSKQATTKEIIIGAGADYKIVEDKYWNIGVSSRLNDAIIFSTGLKMKKMEFAVSYDAHRSKLSQVTNGNGGIELSATIYFNKNKNKKLIEIPAEEITTGLKDRDNDQIPDNMDQCPDIPGVWKFNGCNDKDEDGIYDSIDDCPNLFGHKSNKGCPMDELKDSDMDGLIDEVDECPFLKGLPEHKGCPDSDKDGISDKIDNCPFLKGTPKNNGCPARSLKDIGHTSNDFLPNVHVQFDTDKSDIKMQYFERLNGVAEYLNEHPETTIYISGHTDNEGDPSYNFALGERRSNEVMNYFLQRGISISRMSIISYGETKPVHQNNNVYGKAKNRRVEVTIIQ